LSEIDGVFVRDRFVNRSYTRLCRPTKRKKEKKKKKREREKQRRRLEAQIRAKKYIMTMNEPTK